MDDKLTESVIGAAMAVHRELGSGFLESVYHSALSIEMELFEIPFEKEADLKVQYRGQTVGEFRADFVIEGRVIVEIKAVESLTAAHEVQLVNYLTATGIDIGLLINFGTKSLQFRRKYRIYLPVPETTGATLSF
jgi:GxxExxY protein